MVPSDLSEGLTDRFRCEKGEGLRARIVITDPAEIKYGVHFIDQVFCGLDLGPVQLVLENLKFLFRLYKMCSGGHIFWFV